MQENESPYPHMHARTHTRCMHTRKNTHIRKHARTYTGTHTDLVEQIESSSQGENEVDWLQITVGEVGSHLHRSKAKVRTVHTRDLESTESNSNAETY